MTKQRDNLNKKRAESMLHSDATINTSTVSSRRNSAIQRARTASAKSAKKRAKSR